MARLNTARVCYAEVCQRARHAEQSKRSRLRKRARETGDWIPVLRFEIEVERTRYPVEPNEERIKELELELELALEAASAPGKDAVTR